MNKPMFFTPNDEISTQLNFDAFIDMSKNKLTVFGENLDFESNNWEVTKYMNQKVNKNIRIIFSNFNEARNQNNKKKNSQTNYMKEPFLTFAKAYIRYRQGINPIKSLTPVLTSLRIAEYSLVEMKNNANPTDINADILTRAAQIATEYYSDALAYRLGQLLEELGEFLTQKRIVKVPIDWKNPNRRPSDTQRVGKKADASRNNKMPSKRALEVLPEIFHAAKEPNDIIMISIIALLLGAPNRINEVLFLSCDCEFIQKGTNGKEYYGLRWFPSKGAEPMIKWIIPSMVDVVKLAIKHIRDITAINREIALWYENNPNSIFLPKNLEYLREKEYLVTSEASMIIFGKEIPHGMTSFYKSHKIPYFKKTYKTGGYKSAPYTITTVKFKDLEEAIINLLPNNFPYLNREIGIKYSQALLVKNINEFIRKRAKFIPTITSFSTGNVNDALGCRNKELSLFEKYGFKEKDGSQIKVTTHQFRHYLNTLAQKGGASQLDIAKWSGRKDIKQNADYDHVSADEMLTLMREAIGDEKKLIGPLSRIDEVKKKVIISRDEYAQLKIQTAHITDFGVCIHDFSMMPCQLHMDCISCNEQFCIKGDKTSNTNIKERKEDLERLLKIATKGQNDEHIGANRWVQHHSAELIKLNQLCEILDNPNVPIGSLIQVSNVSSSSQIKQAQERRLQDEKSKQVLEMNELKTLLTEIGDDYE